MSSRHVPARTILVCDRCGVSGDPSAGPLSGDAFAKHRARFSIRSEGKDMMGNGGGATHHVDLCGDCYSLFGQWMKEPNQ